MIVKSERNFCLVMIKKWDCRESIDRNAIIKVVSFLLIVMSSCTYSNLFMDSIIFSKWICLYSLTGILLLVLPITSKTCKKAIHVSDIDILVISCLFGGLVAFSCSGIGFSEFVRISFWLLLYVLGRMLYCLFDLAHIINRTLLFIGIFTLGYCLSQYINGKEIYDIFDTSIGLALVISFAVVGCFNHMDFDKPLTHNWFVLLLSILLIITLVLLKSRTGLLSLAAISMIYFRKKKLVFIVLPIVFVVGLYLFSIKEDSTRGRSFIYSTTFSMLDSPAKILFGHGSDEFKNKYMLYQARALENEEFEIKQRADNIKHPLNEFLLLLVEHGVVSLVIVLVGCAMLLYMLPCNPFLTATLAVIFTFSLFAYPFNYPITYVMLAVSLAAAPSRKYTRFRFRYSSAVKMLSVAGLLLLSFSLPLSKKHHEWKQAYNKFRLGFHYEALEKYADLYSNLHYSPEFIYNYVSVLCKAGYKEKALMTMSECRVYNYETELLRGDVAFLNADYSTALSHFQMASKMCPNRFVPLYAMYQVYGEMADRYAQLSIADEIINKPIKVPSDVIDNIIYTINEDRKKYDAN